MFLIRTRYLLIARRPLHNHSRHLELAFQHIEEQFNCLLSPSIATPNILSKGKLDSRSVNVPLFLYGLNEKPETVKPASEEPPNWSCNVEDEGHTLVITLSVPRLVRLLSSARYADVVLTTWQTERSMIHSATLDLTEPRRVSFRAAGLYALDVSVDRNDVRRFVFYIDGAKCEWIVSEKTILIHIPLLPLPS